MTIAITTFIVSILLQLIAVYLAFRLMRVTGFQLAWAFIALAILLMTSRRIISLADVLESGTPPSNITAELVALVISALMVAGVLMIKPIFEARKKAEETLSENQAWLERTQEIAHLGSWVFDTVANRLTWSDETYRIHGVKPKEFDGRYESFLELIYPEDRGIVENFFNIEQSPHLTGSDIEHRIILPSTGEIRYVYNKCVYTKDEAGQVTRLEGIIHDITERKLSEMASSAKSDFLSFMSHELRTPMNAILGFAQILDHDRQNLNEQQIDAVSEILVAGNHLMELINEILDLTLVEAGKLNITVEKIKLGDIIDECQKLLAPLASENKIRIDYGNPADCEVEADRVRLKQILINFISNAIKYNHPNGEVQLTYWEVAPHRLRISVSDNGIGLDEIQISKLFSYFERLGSEKTSIEGTGIGLALSKRLAELMGGKIGVTSKKGAGSTFWLELISPTRGQSESV